MGLNWRGHGTATGPRGHAPSYLAIMADLDLFLIVMQQHYPSVPIFLYGHSLGGNLVINYALRYHPTIAGIIATAPALRPAFQPAKWKLWLANLLYHLWPSFSFPAELDLSALSHDSNIVQQYRQDPLIHGRLSARLGLDILATGEWALQHANELTLPLLLMHGEADRITSAEASSEFAHQAGRRCTLKLWEGLYHEIHNEPESEAILVYLVNWLATDFSNG
ncbi:MAG: hypothetical protein BWK78_10275 [Thiotrichaceae bacterium IS1]|nr:MAG: hypothetical protein BWK78_10275 [Thiotrichaceae bacterium IS1]